jgi:hypothetical protein
MENAPKAYTRLPQAVPSRDAGPQPQEDSRRARAGYLELLSLGMPRVNWLLIGGDGAIRSLLEMVPLDSLIVTWRPGEPLALPTTPRGGTVLLHDVDRLTNDEQRHLLEWLERPARRARVVSTTSTRLLPHVRAGAFLETLYYNLNTICVDVTA